MAVFRFVLVAVVGDLDPGGAAAEQVDFGDRADADAFYVDGWDAGQVLQFGEGLVDCGVEVVHVAALAGDGDAFAVESSHCTVVFECFFCGLDHTRVE